MMNEYLLYVLLEALPLLTIVAPFSKKQKWSKIVKIVKNVKMVKNAKMIKNCQNSNIRSNKRL